MAAETVVVRGGGGGKAVMVVGFNDSEHNNYALEWTFFHFFAPSQPQQYRLVGLNAKPLGSAIIGIVGLGTTELLPTVEVDLKCGSAKVIEKASHEVFKGDARSVLFLCEVVERHHAEMLVVGSHGYGAPKRVVLGSVNEYCTVMIVKKPKHKKTEQ